MTRRRWAFAAIAGVLGIGILVRVANHYEWGTDLPRDPSYRTGRDSVCEAPPMTGVQRPVPASRSEERPASRGLQRTVTYTIDTSTVTTGARLVVCSEYGRIRVRGSDGSRARIAVTSLNPFPGGEDAVDDTAYTVDAREREGVLQIGVWQTSQGFTGFRSWLARGIRATAVNVDIELPRAHGYDVDIIANHDRIELTDLTLRGIVQGYGSPGADLDVRLVGPLRVHLTGREYDVERFPEDRLLLDRRTGIIARVEALVPSRLEVRCEEAAVRIAVVEGPAPLEVDAVDATGTVTTTREVRKSQMFYLDGFKRVRAGSSRRPGSRISPRQPDYPRRRSSVNRHGGTPAAAAASRIASATRASEA